MVREQGRDQASWAEHAVENRTQAIDRAVALARPRDIVLIAGKGHENYQEFGDYTIPFDDIQIARRAIENHPVEFLSS